MILLSRCGRCGATAADHDIADGLFRCAGTADVFVSVDGISAHDCGCEVGGCSCYADYAGDADDAADGL